MRDDASAHRWMVLQETAGQVPLAVPPLLVPSILAPSLRQQVEDWELLPLPHLPQVPATSDGKRIGMAERTDECHDGTDCSTQTLLANLDERGDASVHQPRDTQDSSLHVNDCDTQSQLFAFTPAVHNGAACGVSFQQCLHFPK